ncbi:class I SAM-dependent methyltransferase [Sneathiella sp.]|uniref:class I SAM-dependent methyltransferase n=1 Tax=Sneathiella sp. TaxID=1964365 RepID=UPI003001CDFC
MTETTVNAAFTGSIPENYDTYLGPLLFEFSGADMARQVSAALDGPAKVLEVACGTGISTRHLANALDPGSELIATDLNTAMLDHAARVNGDLPGVTYSQADALDLPFDDASFAAAVCPFGIMFFPDKAQSMREMTRVLKPGGVLFLNVWDGFAHNKAVGVVDGVIKQFFKTDPPHFLEAPFGSVTAEQGRQLFIEAGYTSIDITKIYDASEMTDYSAPARGFITGNPTLVEVEQRATIGIDELIAAAEIALAEEFGPPPATLSFQGTTFLARKSLG